MDHRCLGLEQELFLIDEGGILSNSADELLTGLREAARSVGKDPACFAPEISLGMIEVIVPPARSLAELSGEYLECLELATDAGHTEEWGFDTLTTSGSYRTTEAEVLEGIPSLALPIPQEEGLKLVREVCDEFEEQAASLRQRFLSTESSTR